MPKFLPGHEQRLTPDPYTGGQSNEGRLRGLAEPA